MMAKVSNDRCNRTSASASVQTAGFWTEAKIASLTAHGPKLARVEYQVSSGFELSTFGETSGSGELRLVALSDWSIAFQFNGP